MARQLTFDLPAKTALGRDDFFVSPANTAAVETVGDWERWPGRKLLLVGPHGSGKTHLAHVWASDAEAIVLPAKGLRAEDVAALVHANADIAVEDIDDIAGQVPQQEALFHLHNLVLAEGGHLLMTAVTPLGTWNFTLPDLASRVQSAGQIALQPADDLLLSVILVKLFADRQLVVNPAVVSYLVSRMDRSFDAAQQMVMALDRAALAERRAITKPLVTRLLDEISNE
jgi:DnaA regulatory inactivator Hda